MVFLARQGYSRFGTWHEEASEVKNETAGAGSGLKEGVRSSRESFFPTVYTK